MVDINQRLTIELAFTMPFWPFVTCFDICVLGGWTVTLELMHPLLNSDILRIENWKWNIFNFYIAQIFVVLLKFVNRSIPAQETLRAEINAWEEQRNQKSVCVNWWFTTEDARIKLKSLYPSIQVWWTTSTTSTLVWWVKYHYRSHTLRHSH